MCGNCGFMLEAALDIWTLPAGAFDDPSWITPERQIFRHVFTRSKRNWSDLSPRLKCTKSISSNSGCYFFSRPSRYAGIIAQRKKKTSSMKPS